MDAFERAVNDFALLSPDAPQREALRDLLIAFIVGEGRRSLDAESFDGAIDALEYALSLYLPDEAGAPAPQPELGQLAAEIYAFAARRGLEREAVLAIATRRAFEPGADAASLERAWSQIEAWQSQARKFSRDPRHSGDSEELLEEVTAVFPAPWLVDQLAATYRDRHARARKLLRHGEMVAPGDQHRLEYTGYKLARLYLRANRPADAVAALSETASDPASIELASLIDQTFNEPRSARPAAELLGFFEPEEPDRLPEYAVTQGWAIVEVIARRTLADHPEDPRANMALADVFMEYGYGRAALHHYRLAINSRDDLFEAWERVAQLEQIELEIAVDESPEAALDQLSRLEKFHARAVDRWPGRPVRPGLPDAYVSVADGLYHAGEVESAKKLVAKAVALEPLPEVLDLAGLIALKERRWDDGVEAYRTLLTLPFENQYDRVYWEIRSRSQLGEIGLRRGDAAQAREDLQAALGELNLVLSLPGIDPGARSLWLTERARVFFNLGEPALAMDDFRSSIEGTPERASAYAEPLLFCVSHGRLAEAREVYAQAMANDVDDDMRLYFTLWIVELARRVGADAPEHAESFLADFQGDRWLESLAAHARGKLSGDELLARASDTGEQAEAHFYEGVREWRAGDPDAGLEHLRQVLETGMLSFFEYEMASDYLSWRDLPKTARSPVH